MDGFLQELSRRESRVGARRAFCWQVALVICAGLACDNGLLAQQYHLNLRPLVIPRVQSGRAILRQDSRETVFLLTSKDGTTEKVALTHPDKYLRGIEAPYAARVIAEIPGRLLIFTDTFASNPDEQGQCGASPTGERFLHVVSLTPPGRESLSVLIDSCWLDIEPKAGTPTFNPASRTLTLRFDVNNGQPLTMIYKIAPDNSVTQ